jgi:RNA polymerase sigma-70 factor, ECF subfamily
VNLHSQGICHHSEVVRGECKSFHFGNGFCEAGSDSAVEHDPSQSAIVAGTSVAPDSIGGYTSPSPEGHVEFFAFDEAYLQRLRDRDFPTEQHFVSYFSQLMLIKLRSRLRSSQAVEDIRQETFVRVMKAVRNPGGIRSAEGLGSFVNSICNNVLQEYYRSSTRDVPADDSLPDPPDKSIDLDGMLVAKQSREHVRFVLSKLSEKERRLLRAIFFEEKNKDEVCRIFGVDRGYLRVLLHRAKQSFRAYYEQAETTGKVSAEQSGRN